jgi:uncharacterized protein YecE (DUF72 family)
MEKISPEIFIGTAGWSIPPNAKDKFQFEGTHLEKYAHVFNAVEINSAFYREHKPETYERWAASVPENFKFSIKLLRYFTQEKRLKDTSGKLNEVIDGMARLGPKLGALLVQLPPSLFFVDRDTEKFLTALRKAYSGTIVWEPRHPTWGSPKALDMLAAFDVSKVLADPDPCYVSFKERAKVESVLYYRLHGTPEIYKSRYADHVIERISLRLARAHAEKKTAWCIFDNTAYGFATENAIELSSKLEENIPH